MGKDIGRIYKRIQSLFSTPSIKTHVLSYLASQTSSATELTITSVPSVRDKNQNNSVLCSKNSIHNDLSITNNGDIQSYGTQRKNVAFQPLQLLIIMQNVFLPHE